MFTVSYPLRFGHCDPAGIAFYPRYFELCDAAIEDWTASVLGYDRRTLHLDRKLGLPTVKLEAEFAKPGRLGDPLDFAVRTRRVGNSSVDLDLAVTCAGEPRFAARYTMVLTDLATMQATAWPASIRIRLNKEVE
jgi:4-hydroxybenzoyl-CoA thioesterase